MCLGSTVRRDQMRVLVVGETTEHAPPSTACSLEPFIFRRGSRVPLPDETSAERLVDLILVTRVPHQVYAFLLSACGVSWTRKYKLHTLHHSVAVSALSDSSVLIERVRDARRARRAPTPA